MRDGEELSFPWISTALRENKILDKVLLIVRKLFRVFSRDKIVSFPRFLQELLGEEGLEGKATIARLNVVSSAYAIGELVSSLDEYDEGRCFIREPKP